MERKEKLANDYHTLETERLILRPVLLSDAQDMFEYTSDENVTKFISIHYDRVADVERGIASYFLADPIGKYGVVLKTTGKLIGTIDLRLNEALCTAEFGYVLNPAYHRQGYTYEAVQQILWLAFSVLGLHSVYSSCVTDNIASAKLLEKAKLQKEGIQRQRFKLRDELYDIVIYSILQEEYQANMAFNMSKA